MTTLKASDLITDKEAADILGVSTTYLVHLRCISRQTKLPYKKVGIHVLYKREDVEAFRVARAEKKARSRKKVKTDV